MLEQTYHVGLSKVRMVCNLVHAIIDLDKYSPPATEGQGNSFVNLFMGIGCALCYLLANGRTLTYPVEEY